MQANNLTEITVALAGKDGRWEDVFLRTYNPSTGQLLGEGAFQRGKLASGYVKSGVHFVESRTKCCSARLGKVLFPIDMELKFKDLTKREWPFRPRKVDGEVTTNKQWISGQFGVPINEVQCVQTNADLFKSKMAIVMIPSEPQGGPCSDCLEKTFGQFLYM